MERESLEEGPITTSLLVNGNHNTVGNDVNGGGGGGSATAVVVISTLVAVFGSYVVGAVIGYSSPAESGIMGDLGLSVAEYSLFGSLMTLGAMLGALMSGSVADFIGRRGAIGLSEIFCVMGWLAILFAKGALLLDIGRVLMGCGVGLICYTVPVYIAEITPKNLRGGFASAHQFMITLGLALTYFIGTAITWRALAVIGTIPCVVQLLGLIFVPESPRWLEKVGRGKECDAALQRLRGKNADISQEAAEIREYTETLEQLSKARVIDVFQRKYAHSLILAVGLVALEQFGGATAIAFYASSIFEEAGFSTKVGTIAVAAVQIPMTVLGAILVDRSGRRPVLLVAAVGTSLGCFIAGLSYLLEDFNTWKEFAPILVLVGILIYNAAFGLGMGGIPWLIMSEIFPINMKGAAGSLVSLVNWSSSLIVSYAFNFSMEWSSTGTFFIFFGVGAFTVLFVAKLLPETKGRTLEEIQAAMFLF